MSDAEHAAEDYTGQMKYLNLQKQKFLNDAYSLLIEFGKVIDRAQEGIETKDVMPPEQAEANEVKPDENTPAASHYGNDNDTEESV